MEMEFNEKSYINKIAVTGHTITSTSITLAYLFEVINGNRTPEYYAVFALLCMGPVIVDLFLYRRNSASGVFQHIISISYGIFYLFAILTSDSILTFTFAFPMFMVIILYMDVRCCALIFAGAFFGNVFYMARHALTVGYTRAELPDVEIRIAAVMLTGTFMVMTAKAVKKVNEEKLKRIREQTDATETLMKSVLETSDSMTVEIEEVSDKVSSMGESMDRMHSAMKEVSSGSHETAESVQKQMTRTEQIQSHIGRVKETGLLIEQDMRNTAESVSEGRSRMAVLADQVGKAMDANRQVQEQIRVLSEYTSRMNTITEAITSIASNTGMLALNASIEAARAGEAGRGFAVVAGQISTLANQTKASTVDITELIAHINEELDSVVKAIEVVTESNRQNTESVQVVTESFSDIKDGTDGVEQQAGELLQIVEALESANRDIVENIQTISAITEEVSAHANETYSACEGNASLVKSITGIVSSLNEGAQKLKEAR